MNSSAARRELAAVGLTLTDVAREMGVTRPAVGHYLAGRRAVTSDLLDALERLAGPAGARRVLNATTPKEEPCPR